MNAFVFEPHSKYRVRWSDLLKTISICGIAWLHVTIGEGPVAACFRLQEAEFAPHWTVYV